MNIKDLNKKSLEIRKKIIEMIYNANSGHPGGSLSSVDILVALYFNQLKINQNYPKWDGRDRFVLSKGHAAPALYAVLAEKGYFDKKLLNTFRKFGSRLQGHPDMNKNIGIDMSTGSLGQGFSASVGMALSFKAYNKKNKVYVLLGDGEVQEGIIWEAAMSASHFKLNNLITIIDNNGFQIDGKCECVMKIEPLAKKWEAFGFDVMIINGHDFNDILKSFEKIKKLKEKPFIIIAKTIKGKGVSFMENNTDWHGKAPNKDEMIKALKELNRKETNL